MEVAKSIVNICDGMMVEPPGVCDRSGRRYRGGFSQRGTIVSFAAQGEGDSYLNFRKPFGPRLAQIERALEIVQSKFKIVGKDVNFRSCHQSHPMAVGREYVWLIEHGLQHLTCGVDVTGIDMDTCQDYFYRLCETG